jgi:hypothetical protein
VWLHRLFPMGWGIKSFYGGRWFRGRTRMRGMVRRRKRRRHGRGIGNSLSTSAVVIKVLTSADIEILDVAGQYACDQSF